MIQVPVGLQLLCACLLDPIGRGRWPRVGASARTSRTCTLRSSCASTCCSAGFTASAGTTRCRTTPRWWSSLQQAWDERGLHPRAVAADSAYDAAHLRQELAEAGLRLYAPARHRRSTLPEGFTYDREAYQLLCPGGPGREAQPTWERRVPLRLLPVGLPELSAWDGVLESWRAAGLGRARYRGRLGVAFQAVMTFFVLNTKKLRCWKPAATASWAA